jgi:hypothetical protein
VVRPVSAGTLQGPGRAELLFLEVQTPESQQSQSTQSVRQTGRGMSNAVEGVSRFGALLRSSSALCESPSTVCRTE